MDRTVQRFITDLGVAAYLMMHKYKVIGRRGKSIYFEVNLDEVSEFEKLQMDYLSSEFHRFDSSLMSLKKMGEYMPK